MNGLLAAETEKALYLSIILDVQLLIMLTAEVLLYTIIVMLAVVLEAYGAGLGEIHDGLLDSIISTEVG
jgi:hypothetical protein